MSDRRTLAVDTTPLAGLDRLSQRLRYHGERQAVLAGDLANIDTPGFRARDVDFTERRHKASNRILGRTRTAWVGAVWPDGHCTFQRFSFDQERVRLEYGGPFTLAGIGPQQQASCSDVTGEASPAGDTAAR